MADTEERGFLRAIKENPKDVTTRMAYADWLEEHTRPYEAFQQRVKAGVSEARYRLRRKSDGLFYEAHGNWTARGRQWRTLVAAKNYLNDHLGMPNFRGTPWDDVEIEVAEIRTQIVTNLSFSPSGGAHRRLEGGGVLIHEPIATPPAK